MNPANLVGAISILKKNKGLRTVCVLVALGYWSHRYLEKRNKKKNAKQSILNRQNKTFQ